MYHDGKIGTSHFAEQATGAFFGIFYDGILGIIGFQYFLRTKSNADAALLTPPPIDLNTMHMLDVSEVICSSGSEQAAEFSNTMKI